MVMGLIGLLACQLLGEALVHGFDVSFPGPVLGMFFMLAFLIARGRWQARKAAAPQPADADSVPEGLSLVTGTLLGHLSLLFTPPAVGIIRHAALLKEYGLAIGVSILVSTAAAIGVTAWVFQTLSRRMNKGATP